jgi:transposase
MDNVADYKNGSILMWLAQNLDRITVLFLPTYFPDLIPLEQAGIARSPVAG